MRLGRRVLGTKLRSRELLVEYFRACGLPNLILNHLRRLF
jgi:hypothetical protein